MLKYKALAWLGERAHLLGPFFCSCPSSSEDDSSSETSSSSDPASSSSSLSEPAAQKRDACTDATSKAIAALSTKFECPALDHHELRYGAVLTRRLTFLCTALISYATDSTPHHS